MRPITLTLTLLSLTIALTSGSSMGPISDTPMFPRFTESFDPSIWEMDENQQQSPSLRFRLPNQIIPRHYTLYIRPILQGDPNNFIAPGRVTITVECTQLTTQFVLHAAELNIDTSSVRVSRTNIPAQQLTIMDHVFDNTNETYTIHVQETLTFGELYDIYIEYEAKVANPAERMNGVYWSSYLTELNERRYLATTQFSRTRAFRKTLPSFDEPSQKATFQINVGRETVGYHTLSNMNLLKSELDPNLPGWTWDTFNTTPIMPPTIIAFIVSDFDSETAPPELFHPDKPVSIWGPPPDMKDNGAVLSAEFAAKTLKYFEELFEIEYELPKIDSAGIPDFAAGAMENWGLNTYRVIYLIWKEGINTVAEKFRMASIIGHEIAHQYWGNLVTHAWWNDWWLTEGFASYYEYRSVDSFHPDFKAIERLVSSDLQPALEFDAGPSSVPIHGPNNTHFVENPSTINYSKGACLVNMMRSFMTEQVFTKACSYYLKNRSYTAVHQDALFDDLTFYLSTNNLLPSNNKTVNEIMETWTLQTGFPLVKVSRASQSHIFVSQERFENMNMRMGGNQQQSGLWHVPVFYTTADSPNFDQDNNLPKFWIDKDVLLMTHSVDTSKWILVNPGGNGYYRVMYDDHFESLLRAQLDAEIDTIPPGSRSMIIDDYFAAAYEGYITMTRAMNMMKFISKETNFIVWVPYLKHLRKGYELYADNSANFAAFKTHIEQSMQTALDTIGFEQKPGEPSMDTITRVQLYDWACPMFNPGCVTEANRLFEIWKADPLDNPIPVDIRPSIYCAATSEVASGNWDFLMSQYDLNKDSLVRNALACTPHFTQREAIITKVLNEDISPGDVSGFLERLAANSEGLSEVLTELMISIEDLIIPEKLGASGVANVISAIAIYTSDLTVRTRLQVLISTRPELAPETVRLNAALRRIETNKQWLDNFGSSILQNLTP